MAPVHELNYIHRDIKPENIILAPVNTSSNEDRSDAINPNQSELKLVDFGFSTRYRLN